MRHNVLIVFNQLNLFLDLLLQMCDQLSLTCVVVIYPCDLIKEATGTWDYILHLLLQTVITLFFIGSLKVGS